MKDQTMQSLIEMAIKNEEEAYSSYMELYNMVDDKTAKDTLKFLAEEEKQHKAYLLQYCDGSFVGNALPLNQPVDYKLAETMEKPEVKRDLTTKEVYLIAANKELSASQFYRDLAGMHPEGKVRDMLQNMAMQELKHKEKMEYLYANTVFTQTAGG